VALRTKVPGGTKIAGTTTKPRVSEVRERERIQAAIQQAEQAQQQAEKERADFEQNFVKPGEGDLWIKKTDYNKLTKPQQSAYNKGGLDALTKLATTTPRSSISSASRLPAGLVTTDIADDWTKYVKDTDLEPYQVAERLISKGAPEAVVYAYIQQNPTAERGATVSKYVDKLNKKINPYNDLSDKDQFDLLQKLGFIPEGSRFTPGMTQAEIDKIKRGLEPGEAAEGMAMKPFSWYYQTPEQLAEIREYVKQRGLSLKKLLAARRDLLPYTTRTAKGFVSVDPVAFLENNPKKQQVLINYGYTKAQIKEIRSYLDERGEFEAAHVEPGGGDQWLTREAYNDLSAESQAAYDKGGIDTLAEISEQESSRLLAALDPFATTVIKGDPLHPEEDTSYDIAGYLREHPEDASALMAMGFNEDAVNKALQYTKKDYAKVNLFEKFYDELEDKYGTEKAAAIAFDFMHVTSPDSFSLSHPKLQKDLKTNTRLREQFSSLLDSFQDADKKPDMSPQSFVANYMIARGYDPSVTPRNLDERTEWYFVKQEAAQEFQRLYGVDEAARQGVVDLASIIYPPARVYRPEVELSDITATEWAIGTANVAMLVVAPVLGTIKGTAASIAARGVQTGATGAYIGTLAYDWRDMSPTERIINTVLVVAISAAVLGRPIYNVASRIASNPGVANRIQNVLRAVKSGNADDIVLAANRLEAYGQAMKRANMAGADAVITQARSLRASAPRIARTSAKGEMPNISASMERAIQRIRNLAKEMATSERGSTELAPSRRILKTIDVCTREEWEAFRAAGISEKELLEMVERAAGSRKAFLALIDKKLSYLKNNKITQQLVNDAVDRYTKSHGAQEAAAAEEATAAEIARRAAEAEAAVVKYRPTPGEPEAAPVVVAKPTPAVYPTPRQRGDTYPEQLPDAVARPGINVIAIPEVREAVSPKTVPVPAVVAVPSTRTQPAVSTALALKLKEQTEPETKTKTKPKPETKLVPDTDIPTETTTTTDDGTPEEGPPDDRPPEGKPPTDTPPEDYPGPGQPDNDKKPFRIPKQEGSEKEKRKAIAKAPWAVGFRLGELHGKAVWHTYIPRGDEIWKVYVFGKAPKGATIATGPRSAYKTIQRLRRGKITKAFKDDIGAFTATITPGDKNPRITFTPDARISGRRTPRITPARPKLR